MDYSQIASGQVLSGTAPLEPGQSIVITTEAMASRSLKWLKCEEMSVVLVPRASAVFAGLAGNTTRNQSMGSFVTLKPTAYRVSLSNDFVPAWLLGPRCNVLTEFVQSPSNKVLVAGNQVGPFETYRWRFPKPFYMPPGATFLVNAQRNGNALDLLYDTIIDINISVKCSQVTEGEAKKAMRANGGNPLPYIAPFVPPEPLVYPAQSANKQLANQFQTILFVQRMTGRCAGIAPSYPTILSTNQGLIAGADLMNIAQVRLADTRAIICDKAPFGSIFPTTRMSWTFTRKLEPNEYLTAQLYTQDSTISAPQVAMVGYRNEPIP